MPKRCERQLLLQRRTLARGVTAWIRTQCPVNAFGSITQIEMRSFAKSAGAECAEPTLEPAAAGHVEFVNDDAALHIGHAHVQRQKRTARTELPKEIAGERTTPIDFGEVAVDQPANSRSLVVLENSG